MVRLKRWTRLFVGVYCVAFAVSVLHQGAPTDVTDDVLVDPLFSAAGFVTGLYLLDYKGNDGDGASE